MKTKDVNLGSLILPCEVFTHFDIIDIIDIIDIVDGENEIQLFLDEKFVPPATNGYSSKGLKMKSRLE